MASQSVIPQEHLDTLTGMFTRLKFYAELYNDPNLRGDLGLALVPLPGVEVPGEGVVVPLTKRQKLEAKQAKLKKKLQPATAVERYQRLKDPVPLTVAEAACLSGMSEDYIRRHFAKVQGVNRPPSSVHKRGVRQKKAMTIPVDIFEAEESKWKVKEKKK